MIAQAVWGGFMIEKDVLDTALTLSPSERAKLIEILMDGLDVRDEALDAFWAGEVEARIDAYESGRLKLIPVRDVLGRRAG